MFIVFEGIDGSGKTTVATRVTDCLVEMGIPALYTYEPYFYRDVIKEHTDDYILTAALFSADRIRHIEEVIKPALDKGEWVICDRYAKSTWVYEYYTVPNADEDIVKRFIEATATIMPNVEIVLDIDPKTAYERKNGDMFEDLETLKIARDGYFVAPAFTEYEYVIHSEDATETIKRILQILKPYIEEYLDCVL